MKQKSARRPLFTAQNLQQRPPCLKAMYAHRQIPSRRKSKLIHKNLLLCRGIISLHPAIESDLADTTSTSINTFNQPLFPISWPFLHEPRMESHARNHFPILA